MCDPTTNSTILETEYGFLFWVMEEELLSPREPGIGSYCKYQSVLFDGVGLVVSRFVQFIVQTVLTVPLDKISASTRKTIVSLFSKGMMMEI